MFKHHRLHHRLNALYRGQVPFGWDDDFEGGEACYTGHGPFGRRHHHGAFGFFSDWNDLGGGGRRGGGRMFGPGDLKLLLLALIEQQPRHGYELIRTIEDLFHGQYSPSPGTIYPTLTMLEEMSYVTAQSEEGGRKRYSITDIGRAFLDQNRDAVAAVTEQTERRARFAAKLATPWAIRQALHALKYALAMRITKWNKAEADRVIAILERAAREIASGESKSR